MSSDSDADDQAAQAWYDHKSEKLVEWLGDEHEMVMHAIIPYAVGGGLDLYYYPNGLPGVGIATKELCEARGEGSSNAVFENYEMVMFTKQTLDLDLALDEATPFGQAHGTINAILNVLGPYSADAELNPHETCEFPEEMEHVGGKCIVFDAYSPFPEEDDERAEFGLLLVLEVFRSEMEFARAEGTHELLQRLIDAGHYPYSDLDREPVA